MKKRLVYGSAAVLLAISVLLVVWQGSFTLGEFGPADPTQTVIFWAISSLIFVLMVALGFYLFRTGLKLYIERQARREGSRIRTKLVAGALALSFVPVFFLVLFGYEVMNRSLAAWFTRPAQDQVEMFVQFANALRNEAEAHLETRAALLAAQPEIRHILAGGAPAPGFLQRFATEQQIESAAVFPGAGGTPLDAWGPWSDRRDDGNRVRVWHPAGGGYLALTARLPIDTLKSKAQIERYNTLWAQLQNGRKNVRLFYIMLMALITLFVLTVATWIAVFLSKQISIPITALLDAASEVRRGNLKHRVDVRAVDELAS
ncbi:MAG TPA: hypothetical protein VGF06_16620, partial [Terriglobales bacterium]